ncbi:MAG: DUF3574 domain-containing protein [Clostridiales bacterium]|nr:DUF3574 domain-containing protein [Clostridiales bacterium]
MTQTSIFVGLNDAVTHEQKFDTGSYLSVMKYICKAYGLAFSVHVVNGGYFHEDGSYVEENTLQLTVMDAPEETVREIAKDLCAFFHQESVMVTSSEAKVYFVSEDLGLDN